MRPRCPAAPDAEHAPVHAYDGTHEGAALTLTKIERAPPSAYAYTNIAYDAVDHWSRGASARPHRATPSPTYAYDHPAPLVRTARVARAPGGDAQGGCGTLTAIKPSGVATNSGSRIAANQEAGNAARDRLLAGYPGALPEQSFTTTAGVRRLDILTQGGLGIESKVGRTSLTATTRSRIAKDGLLLRNRDVTGIEWVFPRVAG